MMKRYPRLLDLSIALCLLAAGTAAQAQNPENGQRLSERFCAGCHAINASSKSRGAPPFAAIAAKEKINSEMIASFLLLPHATMPNSPLTHNDAEDIAAFIMGMKR
jgi:mono/diheme cytochrome c family protein